MTTNRILGIISVSLSLASVSHAEVINCASIFLPNPTLFLRQDASSSENFLNYQTLGSVVLPRRVTSPNGKVTIEQIGEGRNNFLVHIVDGESRKVKLPPFYDTAGGGIRQIDFLGDNRIIMLDTYNVWTYYIDSGHLAHGVGPSRNSSLFIYEPRSKMIYIFDFDFGRYEVLDPNDGSKLVGGGKFKRPGLAFLKSSEGRKDSDHAEERPELSMGLVNLALEQDRSVEYRFVSESDKNFKFELRPPSLHGRTIIVDIGTGEITYRD